MPRRHHTRSELTSGSLLVGQLQTASLLRKTTTDWDLIKIQNRLSRRKKGSKNFKQTQDLRTNYINWSVKQIFTPDLKSIAIEDIKDLRRGKKTSRFLSHWAYPKILTRIEQISEELGVQVLRVSPRNTSRKCPECGFTDADNRRGKSFECKACGFAQDADIVGAVNVEERARRYDAFQRSSFEAHIVPQVKKKQIDEILFC